MTEARQPQARRPLTPLEQRARRIRHLGYVFFALAVLWLVGSLVVSVAGGLAFGSARDPFIDARVEAVHQACDTWADLLLHRAEHDRGPGWQVEGRAWHRECSAWDSDASRYLNHLLEN